MRSKKSRCKTKRRCKVAKDARGQVLDHSNNRSVNGNYPYMPGTLLKVDYFPETLPERRDVVVPQAQGVVDADSDGRRRREQGSIPLTLTVVKTFSRTLSCVLLVTLSGEGVNLITPTSSSNASLEEDEDEESKRELKAVLKLYDRRFSNGIREDYNAAPWTPDIEEEWIKFEAFLVGDERLEVVEENNSWTYGSNANANASEKAGREQNSNGLDKRIVPPVEGTRTGPGHREAHMQKICDKVFNAEVSVYRQLQPLQGKLLPVLFGTVTLPMCVGDDKKGAKVSGVLMEYIQPSFSLRDIPENVPDKSMWQELGEMAVKLVQEVGDYGVLDEDVRLDNILVVPVKDEYYVENLGEFEEEADEFGDHSTANERPGGNGGGGVASRHLKFYRAVRIDFGLARVRRQDQGCDETIDEESWRKARQFRDEEGAVGFVLEKHLRKATNTDWDDRPFKFRHSHRLQIPEDVDEADI